MVFALALRDRFIRFVRNLPNVARRYVGLLVLLTAPAQEVAAQYHPNGAVAEYHGRIHIASGDERDSQLQRLPAVPESFVAWWDEASHKQMRRSSEAIPITLESLIVRALDNSSQIKVFSDLPIIRQTAIIEADAAFDWTGFMQSKWNDISQPVGNILTVGGGGTRFRDHVWSYDAGIRRRNTSGGQFEISQQFGFENNNSSFFLPQDQGTAQLTLSYTQPLLRGHGKIYNTSFVVLAQIDAEVAHDEFVRQLQAHLLEVTRAYWGLYLERAALLQKRRLYERAKQILKDLEARREVDAVASQIIRVKAAVSERQADLYRAESAVRNAEERIHALVNDPHLVLVERLEIVPTDKLTRDEIPVQMHLSVETALQNRPEIGQSLKQIKAASIRLDMAKNELLPRLDAVLETYANGLRGDSGIGQAWVDQFSIGEPSYSAGLIYEVPIHNRANRMRHQRRRLELRQLENQFRTTVETLMLEVKVAVREVQTSFSETQAKYHSLIAADKQLEHIRERWRHLPGEHGSINLFLEDVLAAQERLANAEFGYLRAQTTYNLSLMNLKRATGTLLQDERISHGKTCIDCLPTMVLDKERAQAEQLPPPVLTEPDARMSHRHRTRY